MSGLSVVSAVESVSPLLERCVAGEAAAWRGLHRQYHRNTMSVLRRLGVKPEQLEDCCQEVFIDIFRYLPRFRQDADFRTWLYRVCISHAYQARRRAKLSSMLGGLLASSVAEESAPLFEEGQASRRILEVLDELSESERVVFVLFELEGATGKEIANILRCPEATVFRRLHHARKHFVGAVEARGE